MTINEKFKSEIDSLTPEEYASLEASLLADGCRDALITWNDTLVDGHNRYEICTKHNIPYSTIEKEFADENEVLIFIAKNQLSRRNLNDYQKVKLGLRLEKYYAEEAKKRMLAGKSNPCETFCKGETNSLELYGDDLEKEISEKYEKKANEVVCGNDWNEYLDKRHDIIQDGVSIIKQIRHEFNNDKYLYIFKSQDKFKIGISSDVENRLKELKTGNPDLEIIYTCKVIDSSIEIKVHNYLNEYRVVDTKEWFRYSEVILKKAIDYIEREVKRAKSTDVIIGKISGVSNRTVSKVKKIEEKAPAEIKQKLNAGTLTIEKAYKTIVATEKKDTRKALAEEAKSLTISLDLRHGDFKTVLADIADGSVDLILTDPPYPYEFIECWSDLAVFAKQKLKPNGFCIAYSGQFYLPEVMQRMGEHLDYYWTFCLHHTGQGSQIVNGVNLMCRWKPILIYQNGKKKISNTIQDYIASGGAEKDGHEWQQSSDGVSELIKYFTNPNDLVVDTFAGSATTLIAAHKLNRRCIGAEIDEESYNVAKSKISKNE